MGAPSHPNLFPGSTEQVNVSVVKGHPSTCLPKKIPMGPNSSQKLEEVLYMQEAAPFTLASLCH